MNWMKTFCFLLITFTKVPAFNFNKAFDVFKYRSRARKKFKALNQYTNLVEDHHCIPKQWREHELLKNVDFDINCSSNLVIMPNNKGKDFLKLHPNTLVHQGGHVKYNIYVKEILDKIYEKHCEDEKKYQFWLFLHHLKKNMKFNKDNIPWK